MERIYDFDSTPVKDRPRGQREKLKALYQCRTFEEIGKWIAANGKLIYNDGYKRFPEHYKLDLKYPDGMKRYKFRITGCEMNSVGDYVTRKYYEEECRYGGTPIGVPYKWPREQRFPIFNGNIRLKVKVAPRVYAEYRDALAAIGIWLGSGGLNSYTCRVFAQDFPRMNAIHMRRLREKERRYLQDRIWDHVRIEAVRDYPRYQYLTVAELRVLGQSAYLISLLRKFYDRHDVKITDSPEYINQAYEIERTKAMLAA